MCDIYQFLRSIDKTYVYYLELNNYIIQQNLSNDIELRLYKANLYNHIKNCFDIIGRTMLHMYIPKKLIQNIIEYEDFRDLDCLCVFKDQEVENQIKVYADNIKQIEDTVIYFDENYNKMTTRQRLTKFEFDFFLPVNLLLNYINH